MRWKLRGRLAGLLLLSLSFITANAGYSVGPARADVSDPTVGYRTVTNKMYAARSTAQRHLENLFAFVLDGQRADHIDAGVKLAVPIGGGDHKLTWVRPLGKSGGKYVGHLAEMPNAIEGREMGGLIVFEAAQVRDWYFYGASGKMFGAFATRAALGEMPTDAATGIVAILSVTAVPAHW